MSESPRRRLAFVAPFAWRLLLWTLVIHLVAASRAALLKWPPNQFPANKLEFGDETRMGPDVEDETYLGRMVKLKSLLSPTDVEELQTKFTIHTRSGGSSNFITFIPNGFVYSNVSVQPELGLLTGHTRCR